MTAPVMAFGPWRTNGQLIADVARVGYLQPEDTVLDMTYGLGRWWTEFQPKILTAIDIDPAKVPEEGYEMDFRALPRTWTDVYDVVAFDPPYKLNGRPTAAVDAAYGVDKRTSIADRHRLIAEGLDEAKRVVRPGGLLLVKVQDQVASGKVWWQTDMVTEMAGYRPNRCTKVDRFDITSYRAQPAGRRQVHARRNHSTLLVFRRDTA